MAIDEEHFNCRADVCRGFSCIRTIRMRKKDVLEMMATGASTLEILIDDRYLESECISAAFLFASNFAQR
ncbi:MAG: DUF433 domain-containing protein [Synechococcaceae cyanobacterium]|nr:DUF433 domain-containing protein [Synechococcaceae cyanobacterium]